MQAQAQLAEAQRELNHTFVKAAFSGVVTEVPATSPGRYLGASTTAFYLVDDQHVWVDAQPKETEITYVRPGQPATVTIDTYPNETWRGHGGKHQPRRVAGVLFAAGAEHKR